MINRKITKICIFVSFITQTYSIIYCGKEICSSIGSNCVKNKCICLPGFITNFNTDNRHIKCKYKQASSLIAGGLELILGCGIGHFYSGRNVNGTIKLLLILSYCLGCYCSLLYMKKQMNRNIVDDHPYISIIFMGCSVLKITLVIWQIIDAFMFFFYFYNDGNNLPLF